MTELYRRGVLASLLLPIAAPALAQEFGRLKIIVPGGPGSGQDQAARAYDEALRGERLVSGTQIVHFAGGGGMIAISQFLTGERGNGNAIVTQGAGHLSFPISNRTPVSLDDVTPLARLGGEYELIVVRTNSPFRTVGDLIARYRADQTAITWGAGSTGSTDHIFYALLSRAAGIDPKRLNYIPHENTGDIVAALLGGHVQVGAGGYQDFIAQVQGGRMRVLAVGSPERLPGIDAPTLRESGLDVVLTNWRGVSAHPSISAAQLDRLSDLFDRMAKSESWRRILAARGWNDLYLDRTGYAAFIKSEQQRVRAILQELGLAAA